jgi:hypothetical protein
MQAFHNDAALKDQLLERVRRHIEAGNLARQDLSWDDKTGKGSVIGASVRAADAQRYETELGIPAGLAMLHDLLIASLYVIEVGDDTTSARLSAEAKAMPVTWIDSVPVGADLSLTASRFAARLLERLVSSPPLKGARPSAAVAATALKIASLHSRTCAGDAPTAEEWKRARQESLAATDAAKEDSDQILPFVAETLAWPVSEDPLAPRQAVEFLISRVIGITRDSSLTDDDRHTIARRAAAQQALLQRLGLEDAAKVRASMDEYKKAYAEDSEIQATLSATQLGRERAALQAGLDACVGLAMLLNLLLLECLPSAG